MAAKKDFLYFIATIYKTFLAIEEGNKNIDSKLLNELTTTVDIAIESLQKSTPEKIENYKAKYEKRHFNFILETYEKIKDIDQAVDHKRKLNKIKIRLERIGILLGHKKELNSNNYFRVDAESNTLENKKEIQNTKENHKEINSKTQKRNNNQTTNRDNEKNNTINESEVIMKKDILIDIQKTTESIEKKISLDQQQLTGDLAKTYNTINISLGNISQGVSEILSITNENNKKTLDHPVAESVIGNPTKELLLSIDSSLTTITKKLFLDDKSESQRAISNQIKLTLENTKSLIEDIELFKKSSSQKNISYLEHIQSNKEIENQLKSHIDSKTKVLSDEICDQFKEDIRELKEIIEDIDTLPRKINDIDHKISNIDKTIKSSYIASSQPSKPEAKHLENKSAFNNLCDFMTDGMAQLSLLSDAYFNLEKEQHHHIREAEKRGAEIALSSLIKILAKECPEQLEKIKPFFPENIVANLNTTEINQ